MRSRETLPSTFVAGAQFSSQQSGSPDRSAEVTYVEAGFLGNGDAVCALSKREGLWGAVFPRSFLLAFGNPRR